MSIADNVSRETIERLEAYAKLLVQWNPKINLVSKSTISDLWERHMEDSLQIAELHPLRGNWADLGSGAGFPGLPLAIVGDDPTFHMSLIEADARKSVFLRQALRITDTKADVIDQRIEDTEPLQASRVTARALAQLSDLLGFAHRHLAPNGQAVFLKGETWRSEIDAAKSIWSFEYDVNPSKTHSGSVILTIGEIARV